MKATLTIDEACKVLDISKDTSMEDFKSFKRKRLKYLHPDRQTGSSAEEKEFFSNEFKKNMEAIDVFEKYKENPIKESRSSSSRKPAYTYEYTVKTNIYNKNWTYGTSGTNGTAGMNGSSCSDWTDAGYGARGKQGSAVPHHVITDLQLVQSYISTLQMHATTLLPDYMKAQLKSVDTFLQRFLLHAFNSPEQINNYSIEYCYLIRDLPTTILDITTFLSSKKVMPDPIVDAWGTLSAVIKAIVGTYTEDQYKKLVQDTLNKAKREQEALSKKQKQMNAAKELKRQQLKARQAIRNEVASEYDWVDIIVKENASLYKLEEEDIKCLKDYLTYLKDIITCYEKDEISSVDISKYDIKFCYNIGKITCIRGNMNDRFNEIYESAFQAFENSPLGMGQFSRRESFIETYPLVRTFITKLIEKYNKDEYNEYQKQVEKIEKRNAYITVFIIISVVIALMGGCVHWVMNSP